MINALLHRQYRYAGDPQGIEYPEKRAVGDVYLLGRYLEVNMQPAYPTSRLAGILVHQLRSSLHRETILEHM